MATTQTDVKPLRRRAAEIALENYWFKEICETIDAYDVGKVRELVNLPWANINRQRETADNSRPLWMSIPQDRRYGYVQSAKDEELKERIIDVLISVPGIDINATDGVGNTALTQAAERGNLGRIRRLLAVPGIDVNKPGSNGECLLVKLFTWGLTQEKKEGFFDLLARPELDVNVYDHKGRPVLYLAFDNYLSSGARPGNLYLQSFSDGDPALFWALHDDPRNKKTNIAEAIKAGHEDKTYGPSHHMFETSKAQLMTEFMNSKDQRRFAAGPLRSPQGTTGASHHTL